MRPRPGGVNRARAEDGPRPDRDPEPVRSRRQGHGDSLAVCVMRLAPATMSEMAIAMTTRITRCFDALRRAGELGLVAYITAGDPTLDATERIVLALAEAGADVVELGVPFSDPLADGPTIQRASERALRSGTTLAGVLGLVKKLRRNTEVPLVLFSYFNPVLQMGIERFAETAATAGGDGVVVPPLPPGKGGGYTHKGARPR